MRLNLEEEFCEVNNMKLKRSGKKECRTLTMGGELTVGHAGKLKRVLIEELERADNLRLKFDDVEEADITLLQLLCAAHNSALEKNKTITVHDNGFPPAVWNTANSAGMFDNPRCPASGSCVYAQEKSVRKERTSK